MRSEKRLTRPHRGKPFGKTTYRYLAILYIAAILIGFGLLSVPWTRKGSSTFIQDGFSYLFTSVSAFTTTGLTTNPISCTFNWGGQFVILVLVQMGGWGILAVWSLLKSWIWNEGRQTMEERIRLHSERGGMAEGSSFDIVKSAFKTLFIVEVWVAGILTIFFYLATPKGGLTSGGAKGSFWTSLWWGIFHSVTAVNNSGIDIISSSSITPYSSGAGSILSVIFAFASVTGGIGYPVLAELKEKFRKWRRGEERKNFTLFTKISLWMYLIVTIIAFIAIIISETASENWKSIKATCSNDTNWAEKAWQLAYLVISSRSSGFTGLELSSLHEKTQWILLILMFIGASPASAAGGIRSITLFLIIGKIWSEIKGKKALSVWSRTIPGETVEKAYIVFFVSSVLITLASLVIKKGDQGHLALFEASSAFGTSGLTLGITGKTNWWDKTVLMLLMFVGQLGIPNTLLLSLKSSKSTNIQYPEENVRIS